MSRNGENTERPLFHQFVIHIIAVGGNGAPLRMAVRDDWYHVFGRGIERVN